MEPPLVFVHLGSTLPEYLIYNLVHSSQYYTDIIVLIDERVKHVLMKQLELVQVSPTVYSTRDLNLYHDPRHVTFQQEFKAPAFRDNFWKSTTERFFYLYKFMQLYQCKSLMHIENDVLLFTQPRMKSTNVTCVKDAPGRGIASVFYVPSIDALDLFLDYIEKNGRDTNDMQLLGSFPFMDTFNHDDTQQEWIYDGAAIGQYLFGIDPRNIADSRDTRGFINETATLKCNELMFQKLYKQQFQCKRKTDSDWCSIACLHMHSKRLWEAMYYPFHVLNGERIQQECDVFIATIPIFHFHKSIQNDPRTVVVSDFKNLSLCHKKDLVNQWVPSKSRIFVYTHILDEFITYILPLLSGTGYTIVTGNSDHAITKQHLCLLDSDKIVKVYGHNIEIIHPRLKYIPIGIANPMWPHGDVDALVDVVYKTRHYKKRRSLYMNLNTSTFPYRATVLKYLGHVNPAPKPFKEYLQELSTYRYALCLRGNGLDTHRLWECLYLGVTPVILNTPETCMDAQVVYMKEMKLPILVFDSLQDLKQFDFNKDYPRENHFDLIQKTPSSFFLDE